ncbi:MAG TPA: glycosyltransferase [Spirochaetes bacterium]|nr:glycosyltransferase [Spirochaetota bacterium]
MPFFSVIIPTFNRFEPTRRAVESVLAQTFTDFELIVVDDGSTDGTGRLAEMYAGRVLYLRQENRGVSAARNLGISRSTSAYITFLDSDDLWLPAKLAAHAAFITRNPSVRIHQTGEQWVRRGRGVNQMKKHLKKEGDIFAPSLDLCLVSPSAVCVERRLVEEAGFFDEAMAVCEDYDLWLRVLWREKAGLIPEKLTVKHGGHEDQLSRRYWGMDRFRVYAIMKLLDRHGADMGPAQVEAAAAAALKKCAVLAAGAKKRGNLALLEKVERAAAAIERRDCNSRDYGTLLTE